MASIFERKNLDGSITYRVMIRRKGLKKFITSFPTREMAQDFVDKNEEFYCLLPEKFTYDHLRSKRFNEFWRKGE
jgi:hypothetical protein